MPHPHSARSARIGFWGCVVLWFWGLGLGLALRGRSLCLSRSSEVADRYLSRTMPHPHSACSARIGFWGCVCVVVLGVESGVVVVWRVPSFGRLASLRLLIAPGRCRILIAIAVQGSGFGVAFVLWFWVWGWGWLSVGASFACLALLRLLLATFPGRCRILGALAVAGSGFGVAFVLWFLGLGLGLWFGCL